MSIDEWRAWLQTAWTGAFWVWLAVFGYMCLRLALNAVRGNQEQVGG